MTDEPDRPAPEDPTSHPSGMAPTTSSRRVSRVVRRGRRRRLALGVAAVIAVLVIGAAAFLVFGDRGSRTTKATARRSAATAPSTTTTTTAPGTGTGVIPRSSNPVVALAQQYDGRYVGIFTNTTFQTTGPAALEVRINPSSGVLEATVDLNGDLFGGGARIARRIDATVTLGNPNASVVSHTSAFGPVTGKLGTGLSIVLTAPDVPDPRVKTFELTGTLRTDVRGFDAMFTIGFRDGKSAQGTATVLCAPQGQRPSEVTTLCPPT